MAQKRSHFIILVSLIIVAAATTLAGWLYYRNQSKVNEPGSQALTMSRITNQKAISPAASEGGDLWFFDDRGKLYRATSMGEVTEFPLPALVGTLQKAIWPAKGSGFLLQAVRPGNEMTYFSYDPAEKKYTSLDERVSFPVWTGDAKQLVFVAQAKNGKPQLAVSNPDGSGYRALTQLPWSDFDIYPAPDGESALLIRSHLTGKVNKVYRFSLKDGSYSDLIAEGANSAALWSPKGGSFAYVQDGELHIYDEGTKQSSKLGVRTDKGRFSFDSTGRYLFAAVRSDAADKFVKIEISSGEVSDYHIPEVKVIARDLVYSGGVLYFTDSVTGSLYGISR